MALIVLASASGSPGVTTSALGLALTWPRPVLLVEADPTGGSAINAGYFRGEAAPTAGLIDLALAHRDGDLAGALPRLANAIRGTTVSFLSGTRSHGQSRSLPPLWGPLATTLTGLERTGQDVIVDAGRLGLIGCPEPLIDNADLTLLVVRSDLVSLSGARSWAETLREGFARAGAASSLGLLLVGDDRPYTAREVSKVLYLPVVATLAWDERSAAVFSRGATPRRRFDDSPLVRSLHAARSALHNALPVTPAATSVVPEAGAAAQASTDAAARV